MSELISNLIGQSQKIGLDRIIMTLNPIGNGQANVTVHFAIDQQSSSSIDSNTLALRNALSVPIISSGTPAQISLAIQDALDRVAASAKFAVDQFRGKSNSNDVVQGLLAASTKTTPTNTCSNPVEAVMATHKGLDSESDGRVGGEGSQPLNQSTDSLF
jgi:hypothetical protein